MELLISQVELYLESLGGRQFSKIVAGLLGYPEHDRLYLGEVEIIAPLTHSTPQSPNPMPSTSSSATPAPATFSTYVPASSSTPFGPAPVSVHQPYVSQRFHSGIWDSDREPTQDKPNGSLPTSVLTSNIFMAYTDVKSISQVEVRNPVELMSGEHVFMRFAELVADHILHSIQSTGGRRHYVTKVIMASREINTARTWFYRLYRDQTGQLNFLRQTPINPRSALEKGYEFGSYGQW